MKALEGKGLRHRRVHNFLAVSASCLLVQVSMAVIASVMTSFVFGFN